MKIAVVLDGEVLARQETLRMQAQKEEVAQVAGHIGALALAGCRLLVVHGNGPQVGSMLFRSELASHAIHGLPLDVCGADTQGATGYLLQQALQNWFASRQQKREVATLITQVVVEPEQSAPGSPPRKGVGPFFDWNRAQSYQQQRQWEFVLVPGYGYQRAVPALKPLRVVEEAVIASLIDEGVLVICAGGGGVPVRLDKKGRQVGVEAVVDKSSTVVLLAERVGAQTIIFVSHQDRIEQTFQRSLLPGASPLSLPDLRDCLAGRDDIDDSMRRKIDACCRFLAGTEQRTVFFTPPDYLDAVLTSPVAVTVQGHRPGETHLPQDAAGTALVPGI